jgi:hypothetical protein
MVVSSTMISAAQSPAQDSCVRCIRGWLQHNEYARPGWQAVLWLAIHLKSGCIMETCCLKCYRPAAWQDVLV